MTETAGRVFVPPPSASMGYDADGNQTSDDRWNYTWDAENRLIAAECRWSPYYVAGPIPQIKVTFKYDAYWRRAEKKVWEKDSNGVYQAKKLTPLLMMDGT